jgi:pyruvate,water dikinase
LVTDRPLENYISFQFKGGAADVSRKIRRAQLVAQILEQFGFQTEVKEDAAFARMENFEQSVMEDALRVLGYITIHTRQLDMVMGTDHSMEEHRRNILSDLQKIIEKG